MAEKTLTFDVVAKDNASATMSRVGHSAETAGKHFGSAGIGVHKLIGAFAGLAIVDKVGEFLKDSTKAAIAEGQAQAVLERQLHNSTGATKAQSAAVEDWITKTAEATGHTKAELIPTITRLATVTGSTSKAQHLAGIAMDVSAGTGKNLAVVTQALVKAQLGNVAGLGRLGVATKDASGKTLSFHQIQKNLAAQFRGDSAAAANTAAGRMARLGVMWDELKVKVGEKLIPVLMKLGKGLETLFTQMQDGTGPGGKIADIAERLGSALGTLFGFISSNKSSVATFFGVIAAGAAAMKIAATWSGIMATVEAAQAVAAGTATTGQLALNAAMRANMIGLVVTVIAALAAGLIYAYKHSETFRTIVNTSFHAVATVLLWVWNNVISKVFEYWGKAIGGLLIVWSKMLDALSHVPGFKWVKDIADRLDVAGHAAMNLNLHIDDAGKKDVKPKINTESITRARDDTSLLNVALSGLQVKTTKIHIDTSSIDAANARMDRLLSKLATASAGLLTPALATGTGAHTGTHHAAGGHVSAGMLYPVNEMGVELFRPNVDGMITPHGQGSGGGGADSGGDLGTFTINIAQDGRTTQKLLLKLKRDQGGLALGLA